MPHGARGQGGRRRRRRRRTAAAAPLDCGQRPALDSEEDAGRQRGLRKRRRRRLRLPGLQSRREGPRRSRLPVRSRHRSGHRIKARAIKIDGVGRRCRLKVVYRGEESDVCRLMVAGEERRYRRLHVLEFDSRRKRMSVIYRSLQDDSVWLLCKGAEQKEKEHFGNRAMLRRARYRVCSFVSFVVKVPRVASYRCALTDRAIRLWNTSTPMLW